MITRWLCLRHPVLYSKLQELGTELYIRGWRRYLRRHRDCCEFNTMKHCAEKLAVNPKKATCYGYVPERCPDCGRKIPKRIIHRWMDISLFVAHTIRRNSHNGKGAFVRTEAPLFCGVRTHLNFL